MAELTAHSACLALSLALAPVAAAAQEREQPCRATATERAGNSQCVTQGIQLRPESTIGDILSHPAFTGFARHVLPWDDRAYDADTKISNIGRLLPYHSHVEPQIVVDALNRMIADANDGKVIFYDIYSDAEKRAQPAKGNVGLFFLRGKPEAPFALIAPGGGFAYVGSVHEGFPYATEISRQGYNAFVLKYRTGQGGGVANEDMAAALTFIVRNANSLGVAPGGFSLWGSSAGARMAASIGSHGADTFGGAAIAKPAAVVMAYTAHSNTSSNEPPTFAVGGERDGIAPPAAMERRVQTLRGAGVQVEYRTYEGLGHGFGTSTGTSAQGWIVEAVRFWERFLKIDRQK